MKLLLIAILALFVAPGVAAAHSEQGHGIQDAISNNAPFEVGGTVFVPLTRELTLVVSHGDVSFSDTGNWRSCIELAMLQCDDNGICHLYYHEDPVTGEWECSVTCWSAPPGDPGRHCPDDGGVGGAREFPAWHFRPFPDSSFDE